MSSKRKIVIVDDNTDIKEPYEIAFRDSDFDLTFITSSLEAVSYLDHNPADAVLIDLAMREMDGLTLAKEIRLNESKNRQPPARLAWFTAREVGDVEKRVAKRHGVEETFKKPTDPFALIYEIKAWLSEPSEPKAIFQPKVLTEQNGGTVVPFATAIICILALVIVIAVYNNVLHKREEEAAYRFIEKRNELNQMKIICEYNWERTTILQKWLEQQGLKPPPETLIQKSCLVSKKENE
jgi:two-component system alkaline phosphatase synthesis response regulator PhoP